MSVFFKYMLKPPVNLLNRASFSTTSVTQQRFSKITQEDVQEERTINNKDRSQIIPVETSIKYLESKAFKEAYGDKPLWTLYKRNFKGPIPPYKTRKTCIRSKMICTASPCPVCRDEYLVLHYTNVKLLEHFISPVSGEVYDFTKTNLCQRQYRILLVAIAKAKDYGLITFDVPFRYYDYRLYQ